MTDSLTPPPPSQQDKPWWKDVDSTLEVIAIVALAVAVLFEITKGKLELTSAAPLLVGGLTTITAVFKSRANR